MPKNKPFALTSVLVLCALGWAIGRTAPATAQELVTDRPDQTESAVTVAPGQIQVEIGVTHTEDDEDGVDLELDELGGTLVRIGLAERLELRLGWSGYLDATVTAGGRSFDFDGSGDGDVGFKYVLRETDGKGGSGLQIALMAGTTVPIGDDAVTSDEYDPFLRFLFAQDLSHRVSLGYNLGVEWETVDGDRLSRVVYTLALGFGLTERWGAFVELFGDVPLDDGNLDLDGAVSFDGGFTYLLKDNLQLDFAGGIGLNDEAPDWFVGVGVSFRLPN